ncbi:hypothetical protein [Oceanithermus sp.]
MRKLLLLSLLAILLGGCLETEARLTWHPDGSMDLTLSLKGDAVESQRELIVEQLRADGFQRIRVSGDTLSAEERFKEAGWDRLSGWLPGRFVYRDPSGLEFSRVSRVVYEDYVLSGTLDVGRLVELPIFVAAMNLPFTFAVEAPWPALASNADRVEGKTYLWERTLGKPFAVKLVYRRWYPERAAVLALLLVVLALALWRRLRRRSV